MAGISTILRKFLGPDSVARQFFVWNILAEVSSTAVSPFLTALRGAVNSAFPVVPLTPSELAVAVIRDEIDFDEAAKAAALSGMHKADFRILVEVTGRAPTVGELLPLYREGKITLDEFNKGLKESDYKGEWFETIMKMAVQPPTPDAILNALLQGQVTEPVARDLYAKLGGDPKYFTLLYNTFGTAPTPLQAADMAVRGIIPWDGTGPDAVSFHQAFLEGPWRNKWLESFRKAAENIPPPDTITEMIRVGALDNTRATELLLKNGVPQDLVGAWLAKASTQKTEKIKELTESTVANLYQEEAITTAEALEMLGKLKYAPEEATFVLTAWRLSRELRYRNSAIGTVRAQFLAHRIDVNVASGLLDKFRVSANQRDVLLALWTEEEKAKVSILTAAQVRTALNREVIPVDDAIQRLINLGYSEEDALIFIQL
jgi:hypothetical protein